MGSEMCISDSLKIRRLLLEKEQSKVTAAYADLYAEYHELVMGRE